MKLNIDENTRREFCEEFLENNRIDPRYYQKYDVKRGLRNADGTGVLAGLTNICNVHGYIMNEGEKQNIDGELYYRGYSIYDLVAGAQESDRFGYEEVAYLLLLGKLPTLRELANFNRALAENRELPPGFFEDMILKAPSKNIMNKLARAILALYSYAQNPEPQTPDQELSTAVSILAKMPVIMTSAYQVKRRVYDGKSMYMHQLNPEESTAETILSLLRHDRVYTDEEAKLLDLMLMLHAEHGGGNNSTFACRVLTSSGTDPYSAYAAAVGSLKGPKHGGANIKVMQMMQNIKENVPDWKEATITDYIDKILKKETFDHAGLIYGMGHAVYTLSDPRAEILKMYAEKLAVEKGREEEFHLYETVENSAKRLINEQHKLSKPVCANVDLYSGFVYSMLNLPTDLYTPLFAISRVGGWSAHRMEELINGNRIIRPSYHCVKPDLDYIPMDERK